jgi:hypothetical protein
VQRDCAPLDAVNYKSAVVLLHDRAVMPGKPRVGLFQTGAIRLAQPRAGFRGSRNLRHRVSVAGPQRGHMGP